MKKHIVFLALSVSLTLGYAQATKAAASDVVTMNNEGVTYLMKGDFARAEERFISALKIDPSYQRARANLSVAFNNHGLSKFERHDPITAIRLFHQGYLVDPANETVRRNLDGLMKLLEMDPTKASDHVRLGDFFMLQDEYLSALSEYEIAEAMGEESARLKCVEAYDKCEKESAFMQIHTDRYGKLRTFVQLSKEGKLQGAEKNASSVGSSELVERIYVAAVSAAIAQQWKKARPANTRSSAKNSKVEADVTIEKDGTITSYKLKTSSGNQALDKSLLKAIEASSPVSIPLKSLTPPVAIRITVDPDPQTNQSTK